MQSAVGQPWFHSAIERLDLRPRDRLLAIDCDADETMLLSKRLGRLGELTLVLREVVVAERLARHLANDGDDDRRIRILAHDLSGDEVFGAFDSLVIAPRTGPLPPVAVHAQLVRRNLRPGGRFVIDLPAEHMLPDLRSAWLDLGWDEERLLPLSGPQDVELAEALRAAGLRNVQPSLGSHLLHLSAPADLVDAFHGTLGLDDDQRTELTMAVVTRRRDPGPIDALVHRTQIAGQR